MNKKQEFIEIIKHFLDDAENMELETIECILDQVVTIITGKTRIECWILVENGKPLDTDYSGISSAIGLNPGECDDIHRDLWVSMHDTVLEKTFPPGTLCVNFVASNLVHQEGQMSLPETGQWDFLPYWEHDIEMTGVEVLTGN